MVLRDMSVCMYIRVNAKTQKRNRKAVIGEVENQEPKTQKLWDKGFKKKQNVERTST